MYKKVSFSKIFLVFLCCATLSGCAVFKGGNVPEITLTPLENTGLPKKTVSYNIIAKNGLSTVSNSPEVIQNIIAGEFLQTLEQSEYFSRISKKDNDADLELSITVTNTGSPAALIPAIITGLSLYTIPSWATDNFEVVAIAKNKEGTSREYVLKDSTTLVQWLPMMFAFPVKNFSAIPEVRKNMYKNIIKQMKDDGFLNKNPEIKTSNLKQ